MRYLFCGMCFILMNYSISQTSFNFVLKQSKDIGEIQSIYIKNTNNSEILKFISKKGNFYKFEGESQSPVDTLVIELKTLKHTYKANIYIHKIYSSNKYPLNIELISYKRFLLPKYYNLVISYKGLSQPFFMKRYKNKPKLHKN